MPQDNIRLESGTLDGAFDNADLDGAINDTPPLASLCEGDGEVASALGDGIGVSDADNQLFQGCAISRQGGRAENQDSLCACQTRIGALLVVCDGMGGGPGGKTASTIACQTIAETANLPLLALPPRVRQSESGILDFALERANGEILRYAAEHPELRGMGTTCAVVLITRNKAFAMHVGDSRIYQLRHGRKVYRTTDHSQVFELLRRGLLKTEEEARLSPRSNIITSALGIAREIPHVESRELPYKHGDLFLLTTDGIHGTMMESRLVENICHNKKAGKDEVLVMRHLADTIDTIGKGKGNTHDNHTGILVRMKHRSAMGVTFVQSVRDFLARLY